MAFAKDNLSYINEKLQHAIDIQKTTPTPVYLPHRRKLSTATNKEKSD